MDAEFRIVLWVVGGLVGVVLAAAVYQEVQNPCVRWKQESTIAYRKVGDTLIPFPYTQTVCAERRKR